MLNSFITNNFTITSSKYKLTSGISNKYDEDAFQGKADNYEHWYTIQGKFLQEQIHKTIGRGQGLAKGQ